MTRRPRAFAACVAVACALAGIVAPATRATAAPGDNCAQSPQERATPWAQQMLGADRAWPLSTGGGRRVAVLDSGVDAAQPRLGGRVEGGYDALTNTAGTADTDCRGTGTEVAGVLIAQQGNDGLAGVMSDGRIVPVRVVGTDDATAQPDPGVLARGMEWAIDAKVSVICVSVAVYKDDPLLAQAVQDAEDAGIPVVAATGDRGAPDDNNPKPYPASYRGVIGVGAIDSSGARWQGSGHGSYVDLVAPGVSVLTTWRGQGTASATGTGVAAGFVAGTAALVQARWRSGPAQVRSQLAATALPAGGGPRSADLGVGVVNPYGAVSEVVSNASPVAAPAFTPPGQSAADRAWAAAWVASHRLATVLAGVAVALVLLVVLAALAIPRGRRRSWRPTLAARTVDELEPDEPPPPTLLFDD